MKNLFDSFAWWVLLSATALAFFVFLAFDAVAVALTGTPLFFLIK